MLHHTASTETPVARSPEAGFLYRFEADIDMVPIGITPEGFRATISFDGRATAGIVDGARVWGIDPFILRPDGVGVITASKTLSGNDFQIFEEVRAYLRMPEGMDMPPLDAFLDPDFTWPDALFPIHGFSTFSTGSADYAYLNGAHARVDGWSNLSRGRLAIETRLTEHLPVGEPSSSIM